MLSSHQTRLAIRWFVAFLLAFALQLVLLWAVKDPAIQATLINAIDSPFIFLFCLTVTIIYSRNGGAKDKSNNDNKLTVFTAVRSAPNNENPPPTNTGNERNNDEHENQSRPVLYYLMNLKVFLTFTVVTHHMAVAFSGIPAAPLVIGSYPNGFSLLLECFSLSIRVTLCPCFISSVPTFVKQV